MDASTATCLHHVRSISSHLIHAILHCLRYSREFHAFVMELLTKAPSVFALCDMLSGRAFDELDSTYLRNDSLENRIISEFGAGRLFHVLLLLSFTSFGGPMFHCLTRGDENFTHVIIGAGCWQDTGDQYLLALFCEYVFRQNDHRGFSVTNNGHVSVSHIMRLDFLFRSLLA